MLELPLDRSEEEVATTVSDEDSTTGTNPSVEAATPSSRKEKTTDRLERVESALKLVLDHLETLRKGSETLEAHQSRTLLSSIALGISSVSIIALWSIAILYPDRFTEILRFSIGMSLVFLASAIDLGSTPLLRRAVSRAISENDQSRLVLGQGSWHRFFVPSYWAMMKKTSSPFFYHQILRCTAFVVYVVALALLIWAIQLL